MTAKGTLPGQPTQPSGPWDHLMESQGQEQRAGLGTHTKGARAAPAGTQARTETTIGDRDMAAGRAWDLAPPSSALWTRLAETPGGLVPLLPGRLGDFSRTGKPLRWSDSWGFSSGCFSLETTLQSRMEAFLHLVLPPGWSSGWPQALASPLWAFPSVYKPQRVSPVSGGC